MIPRYCGAHLRAIRARNGVGRPPRPLSIQLAPVPLEERIIAKLAEPGMTQRKAAAALGISRDQLQRRLKKATTKAA